MQAHKMLDALGICDVELVTWVQPRAKVANAANAAAGAGAAVKAEATTGSFSSLPQQKQHRSIGMRDGLAGGSVALAVCLRLNAEVLHERSVQQWRQWRALLASVHVDLLVGHAAHSAPGGATCSCKNDRPPVPQARCVVVPLAPVVTQRHRFLAGQRW